MSILNIFKKNNAEDKKKLILNLISIENNLRFYDLDNLETNNFIVSISRNEETDARYLDIKVKNENINITATEFSGEKLTSYIKTDRKNNNVQMSYNKMNKITEEILEEISNHFYHQVQLDSYKPM